jgi:hypothetical protein
MLISVPRPPVVDNSGCTVTSTLVEGLVRDNPASTLLPETPEELELDDVAVTEDAEPTGI